VVHYLAASAGTGIFVIRSLRHPRLADTQVEHARHEERKDCPLDCGKPLTPMGALHRSPPRSAVLKVPFESGCAVPLNQMRPTYDSCRG
jgi:hypothetical protein